MAGATRRVQLTGRSTFIISLPKDWAVRNRLEPGMELRVEQLPDGSLLIRPPGAAARREGRTRRLHVSESNVDLLVTEILAAYLAGYTGIEVVYSSVDPRTVLSMVEEARERALGLEVMEEDFGRVLLYTITGPPTISVSKALERMVSVARSMLDNLSEALRKSDDALLDSIIDRDTIVDKFFLLIMRQLSMLLRGEITPREAGIGVLPEILYKVIAAKSVERVADHAVIMSRVLKATRREAVITDDLLDLYSNARSVFTSAASSLLRMDRALAFKARRGAEDFWNYESQVRRGLVSTAYLPDAAALLDSIRRIVAYSVDISEATINIVELREAGGP